MLAGTVTLCGVSPVCTVNLSIGNLLFFVACHFFFFAVITIVLLQSVGMLTGTGVMIPLFTSSQRACLTGSLKWNWIGLCLALGTAPSFRWIWAARPDIGGNSPFFLKDVLVKCYKSHSLSLGMFRKTALNYDLPVGRFTEVCVIVILQYSLGFMHILAWLGG